MAMIQGSVTVNDNNTYMGTGAALVIFEAMLALIVLPDPNNPPVGFTSEQILSLVVASKRELAKQAVATASLINYINANGDVRVPANSFGVGVPTSTVVLSGAIE
jgi:hypothetical protein